MDERLAVLVEAWLDGGLGAAEVAELEGLLLGSAAARQAFWDRAAFHGLLREAAKIAYAPRPDDLPSDRPGPAPGPAPRRLVGRMVAAIGMLLLGGSVVGSAVTALAFAQLGYAKPAGPAVVVHAEGFERPPAPLEAHIPKQFDVWGGDDTEVVGAEGAIAPHSGARMLRFVAAQPPGAVYRGRGSEIWRLLDLDTLRAAAGSDALRVELAAHFNGLVPAAGADARSAGETLQVWLSIVATDAQPDELRSRWDEQFSAAELRPASIATAQARERLDADPATWERLAISVTVPAKARFLLVHCSAEQPPGDLPVAERPRQYIDDITLAVQAVEPAPGGGGRPQRNGGRP